MKTLLAVALTFAQSLSASEVRVRVLELFHAKGATLAAPPGRRVSVQRADGRFVLEGSRTLQVALGDGRVVVEEGPVRVRIADQIERTFHASLAIETEGEELRIVATMPLEEAVAAIVAAEAGRGAAVEMKKAQAIASRSFLTASRGRHAGYDFCDTTHCQHLAEADAESRSAAQATAGTMLTHAAAVLEALSTRRCGGETRTLADVGLNGERYPYFRVRCEPCRREPQRWERRWPEADVAALIRKPGAEGARLEVVRRLGWSAIPSNAYRLRLEGNTAALTGEGEGHGVGLCQFGAMRLAEQGWSAAQILRKYFVNAAVAGGEGLRQSNHRRND